MHLVTRRAPIPAASFDRETRRFTAIAATGTPAVRFDWGTGSTVNEVLVVDAASVDLARLGSGRAPLLNGHRAGSAADQIGVIRSAWVEGGQLIIEGELSGRADVAGIVDDMAAGVLSNVSVGYRVTASERVPAAGAETDTIRVTRWQPVEVSLVPVPADPGAYVRSGVPQMDPEIDAAVTTTVSAPTATRPASGDTRAERGRITALRDIGQRAAFSEADVEAAIEDGTSAHDFRARAYAALADGSSRTMTRSTHGGGSAPETNGVAMAVEGALYARMTGTAPEGRAREFMGRTMLEMGVALLESRGERVRWSDRDQLAGMVMQRSSTAGWSTTADFPNLLLASGNRVLDDAYQLAATPLKLLARRRTRNDFRAVTGIQLSEAPRLQPVLEKGEITWGSRVEEGRPLYNVRTYARLFGLSRTAIINDDLNAFADALSAFGEGAAQTENDQLAALFTANGGVGATLWDGKPLYDVSRGNVGSNQVALSVAALGAGRQALRSMKSLDGKTPINVVPAHLVVAPELETTAEQVLAAIYAAKAIDANVFQGKLTLHVEPRFTGNAFRLFADPGQMACLEISYLAGREGPQLTFREGWETLGAEFRAVLDFGCGIREWRSTYMSPAA